MASQAEIFKTALPDANRIYLTRIHHNFDGDVYFPQVSEQEWDLTSRRFCEADEKNIYNHTYEVWNRK